MYASAIAARLIKPCLEGLHRKRTAALMRATTGLWCGGVGSLSGIALWLSGSTRLEHRLNSVLQTV